MHGTSVAYRTDFYKEFRNNSYCNISFVIEETEPRIGTTTTCNVNETEYSTNQPWESNTSPILSIATLEQDRLILDGSLSVFNSDSVLNTSFVAEPLSDANGEFVTNPIITIEYADEYSYAGLTLLFDEFSKEYAIDFEIKAYSGNELVDTKTVTGNNEYKYVYIHNYDYIDKITIEFKKVLPYHRARLSYITYGIEKNWTNDDLMDDGLICINRCDPLSRELPENSIEFTIDNYDNLFNPDNPTGIYRYLHENLEITTKIGYKLDSGIIEWMPLGKHFLSEWSADDFKAKFKAIGLLNTLTNPYLEPASTTTQIQNVSLASKLNVLVTNEGLNGKLAYAGSFSNTYTEAPIPSSTVAEALQYIANANNAVLYTDRDGTIILKNYSSVVYNFTLGSNLIDEDSREIEVGDILKNVNVKWYKYTLGSSKTIYTGNVSVTGVSIITIELDKPAQDISVSVSGAELLTHVDGYMRVDMAIYSENTATASITITGREIESVEQEYVHNVGEKGEDANIDNPIITNMSNVTSVATYIQSILTKRNKYKFSYRGSPELDVGDVVLLDTQFSTGLNFLITNNTIKFNGGISGELEGRIV